MTTTLQLGKDQVTLKSGAKGLVLQTRVKRLIIIGLDQYKVILLGIAFTRDKDQQDEQGIP
jgi:hypothetical protein